MVKLKEFLALFDWNEIFQALITIFAVVVGFVLASWNKWRDEKKSINNIKNVLFLEIYYNYKILNNAMKRPHEPDELKHLVNQCVSVENLSTDLYERFLDRVNILEKDATNIVIFAYQAVQSARHSEKAYKDFLLERIVDRDDSEISERDWNHYKLQASSLESSVKHAHDTLFHALIILSKGRKDFIEMLQNLLTPVSQEVSHREDEQAQDFP